METAWQRVQLSANKAGCAGFLTAKRRGWVLPQQPPGLSSRGHCVVGDSSHLQGPLGRQKATKPCPEVKDRPWLQLRHSKSSLALRQILRVWHSPQKRLWGALVHLAHHRASHHTGKPPGSKWGSWDCCITGSITAAQGQHRTGPAKERSRCFLWVVLAFIDSCQDAL